MTEAERVRIIAAGGEALEVPTRVPLLPVRGAAVLPGMSIPLVVGRPASLAALDLAGTSGFLLVATQVDPELDEPGLSELHPVGCLTRVARVVDTAREGKQAIVAGIVRARLVSLDEEDGAVIARIDPLPEPTEPSDERDAGRDAVLALAHRIIELREDIPDEWKEGLAELPSPGLLADLITSYLRLPIEEVTELLQEPDPTHRLRRLLPHLEREATIAETQQALDSDAEREMDPKQREKLLRRRMRDIEDELGESDGGQREADELRERIEAAELPEEAQDQADRELRRLRALPSHAPDRHMIRTYLEWMADLPWSQETEDKLDLALAKEILDDDHHGLDKVKDRILEFLAVRKLAPTAKAPILCLVGPPGVGKTSLGRSIARTMERQFTRASLGGVRDEAEIRGHRRTYVGAMPGRVLQSLRRAGSRNPVFLLDEIDKLGADFRGDPSAALLEVLDPEQNTTFSDHYLEVPFDLSKVLFIATANTLSTIPGPLLDRMEVIELPGYTDRDKLVIARDHLIPKQLEAHGLSDTDVVLADEAVDCVVHEYTREAGVRNLERQFATLIRKSAARIAGERSRGTERTEPLVIDTEFVAEALGAPPHLPEAAERTEVPGVVVGLAATAHGGDILFLESTVSPGGEGVRLKLTGQLGDVMRESAEAALSWVRANAERMGLPPGALEAGEIHLHVPAGAVPKDGPSAGVALATAMLSVLTGRRALGTVAMTGEISLRGKVLPVGGIKAKLLAALRAGIQTVLLPRRNEKDLVEVPEEVRDALEIILIDGVEDAVERALEAA